MSPSLPANDPTITKTWKGGAVFDGIKLIIVGVAQADDTSPMLLGSVGGSGD